MSIPPLPDGVRDSLRHRVANGLHSAAIRLLRRARRADLESGLSPERLSLLSVLAFAGPRSVGKLAAIEQVSAPAVSRIVGALEQVGFVRRERSTHDRRVVLVELTEDGRAVVEDARRRRLATIAALLGSASSDELEMLERAAALIETLSADG